MISTPRLLLRQWKESDKPFFAALNADARVREFFPGLLSREDSDAMVDRMRKSIDERGYGFWCVELPGICECIGFVGIINVTFESWFTPAIEIGWRLAFEHQKKGYATEAAMTSLDYAKNELRLKEIYSFTVPANVNSRNVMKKIGMEHIGEFDHPNLPADSPLRRHVLYRKSL